MNIPRKIVLHHSTGYDHPVIDNWQGIREYHVQQRGWRNVGYHYGIEFVDNIAVIQYGRKPHESGAHAPGSNSTSIGICVIGDYTKQPPDFRLMLKLVELLKYLIITFNIDKSQIFGHYEVMPPGYTECPGKMFPLREIKELING